MPKQLILFPFGGNAKEAIAAIIAINKKEPMWDVLGFIDDDSAKKGMHFGDFRVLGGREILEEYEEAYVLAVPGSPETYLKRAQAVEALGIDASRFATVIHPSVDIMPNAQIGHNTLLMANVVVSCDVHVGNHCVVLPNTVLSHDCAVGDYCLIGSNVSVSGQVKIGENCYIGSRTSIKDKMTIGRRSLVGLGSNVVSVIPENVVAAGNPAKVMRKVEG